ncbi:hypothetical protein DL96DRAFT_1596328 [Flagelloscypha sp. PMI_526]|nr:hypothetical protein DL96DRAFT_1596328 [Flagelloscypha sp. PMI_526]
MLFPSILVALIATSSVLALPQPRASLGAATITEPTIITAKKVIHTLLDHSPFISDFTTTVVFTQQPPPSSTPA